MAWDMNKSLGDLTSDPIKAALPATQIAVIAAAAEVENAINTATLLAKIATMGLKAAKDIVG